MLNTLVTLDLQNNYLKRIEFINLNVLPVGDPGFLNGGFSFSSTKTPAQFELKTKKRSSTFIPVFYIYYWMISNKTTVFGASQSDCSIRESRTDCSIRVYEFQKGVSVETLKPPWIRHCLPVRKCEVSEYFCTKIPASTQNFASLYATQHFPSVYSNKKSNAIKNSTRAYTSLSIHLALSASMGNSVLPIVPALSRN